jgi:AcrR family transcriptional regulator
VGRKDTQLERIQRAMLELCATQGYAQTTVAHVIALAGVSRPTFYEYHADKQDCLLAALERVYKEMLECLDAAVQGVGAARPAQAAVDALARFAHEQPQMARVAIGEAMAAGPRAQDARDRAVARLAATLERGYAPLCGGASAADVDSRTLVGACLRMLGQAQAGGGERNSEVAQGLGQLIARYARPLERHRWRSTSPLRGAAPRRRAAIALLAPAPLSPGRPRAASGQVAENHRMRILLATAEVIAEHGYLASTLSQIIRAAGVDGRTLHRVFSGKEQAFAGVQELAYQALMAALAPAFLSSAPWPERIWRTMRALGGWVADNPTIAHAIFVEADAGEHGGRRLQENLSVLTVTLRDGYGHSDDERAPTQAEREGMLTLVFETVYRRLRHGTREQLYAIAPELSHVMLAPFLGVERAERFIEERVRRAEGSRSDG